MKKKEEVLFHLSSWGITFILGVIGIAFMIVAILWKPAEGDVLHIVFDQIMGITGQTLLGSCAISLLLEISTLKSQNAQSVKEGCRQVLATIYGENPKYFTNLSLEKNSHVRVQLIAAALNQQCENGNFIDKDIELSALMKFENRIMDSFLKGIICDNMVRRIQIEPVPQKDGTTTYKVYIRECYHLKFLTDNAYSELRNHRFRFISQKQNDSFELKEMIINEVDYKASLGQYVQKQSVLNKNDLSAVGNRTFDYLVCINLPRQEKELREMEYKIEYTYENYEMGTYLTSALNYLTYNISEDYSIIGEHAREYIIHGFSHFPYHSQPNKKIHIERVNSSAIKINISNDWQLPGSGCSVVVRQKNIYSEILN